MNGPIPTGHAKAEYQVFCQVMTFTAVTFNQPIVVTANDEGHAGQIAVQYLMTNGGELIGNLGEPGIRVKLAAVLPTRIERISRVQSVASLPSGILQ